MERELEVLYEQLSAKRDTREDCTETMQRIVTVQSGELPIFIPAGTYMISDTILINPN